MVCNVGRSIFCFVTIHANRRTDRQTDIFLMDNAALRSAVNKTGPESRRITIMTHSANVDINDNSVARGSVASVKYRNLLEASIN